MMNKIHIMIIWFEAGSWVRKSAQCTGVGTELDITKKNFELIHVYFIYTVFRATYRAVISKVTFFPPSYLKIKCPLYTTNTENPPPLPHRDFFQCSLVDM